MHNIIRRIHGAARSLISVSIAWLRRNIGHIAYYACVALALTGLAVASEGFRSSGPEEVPVVLPVLASETPQPAAPMFEVPESMQVVCGYSVAPVWNSRQRCWQSHIGADFACADGKVYSLSGGTVLTAGKSGIYGGFVEIETAAYLLRYCSVDVQDDVEPGMQIRAGDTIGTAANDLHAEEHMGPHLHLEVYRDGESLDFETVQHELTFAG